MTSSAPTRATGRQLVAELSALDQRLYEAVATTDTPTLDHFFRRLSTVANKSLLWLGIAGGIAVVGGRTGRWAALNGVVSIGLASATANLAGKHVTNRRRPDRAGAGVPGERHVPMPESTSFPSGHAASAFAFAEGVGSVLPALGLPLRVAAVAVGYSRVHVGVHYPGDVVGGALIGRSAGEIAPMLLKVIRRRATPGELGSELEWSSNGMRPLTLRPQGEGDAVDQPPARRGRLRALLQVERRHHVGPMVAVWSISLLPRVALGRVGGGRLAEVASRWRKTYRRLGGRSTPSFPARSVAGRDITGLPLAGAPVRVS